MIILDFFVRYVTVASVSLKGFISLLCFESRKENYTRNLEK